jgi:hypothetical protein
MISSCDSKSLAGEYSMTKSPDCVYAPDSFVVVEIPNQKLDIKSCLSLRFGNENDIKTVKSLPEKVLREADKFIKSRTKFKTRIYAAREIGDYILIFVNELGVADGGFEFIYSKKTKKVIGIFIAGYRG